MSTNIFQRDLGLARNLLGQPLDEDCRARLAAAVQHPGQDTWDAAYGIILNAAGTTLWQALLIVDPGFRAVLGPVTVDLPDPADCGHPERARDFIVRRGTFDYWYETCAGCAGLRPVHEDDDGCATCLDGGHHEWARDPEAARTIRSPWSRTPDAWAIRQAIAFATH